MRIKTIQLKDFKRFNDLTLDLNFHQKKIIALVGPNGSGKSSVFDGFEQFSTSEREKRNGMRFRKKASYFKKSFFQLIGLSSEEDGDDYDSQRHVFITSDQQEYTNTSFYIRSAHRFTPRIDVTEIKTLKKVEEDEKRPKYLIDADSRLEENYERLIGGFFYEVYNKEVTGRQWSDKNIENLNNSLSGIVDISIVSLGNPTEGEGSLYFKKGTSNKFPYENLSAGEKEVVDLILDLYVKRDFYSNTVICIDEPELHLNTSIQRKLLIEIEKIIPDTCQLWVATHSIGFLRALQEDLKEKTAVIDFLGNNFDEAITLKPIFGTRKDWIRIFETALEDLTGLLAPKKIIYCEGRKDPGKNGGEQGLDAEIYNKIFESEFPDTLFVSSGGSTEPDKYSEIALKVLNKAFDGVDILLLKDKDLHSNGSPTTDEDRTIWLTENINTRRMLLRKEIENYLYDIEILTKYKPDISKDEYSKLVTDIKDQDVKEQDANIKKLYGNEQISRSQFKQELSGLVTSDTKVYQELKKVIFNPT